MRFFLDTNICIYLLREHPPEVMKRFLQHPLADIGVSSIVVAELQHGVSKSKYRERNQRNLDVFLKPLSIVSFDQAAAKHYGEIRADLERQGRMIGREDALIAAHTRSRNLTLITNNESEFMRVPNLKIDNWA